LSLGIADGEELQQQGTQEGELQVGEEVVAGVWVGEAAARGARCRTSDSAQPRPSGVLVAARISGDVVVVVANGQQPAAG
jgi:hypothetical protein